MPHLIVKMKVGRTDEHKQQVAQALAQTLASALGVKERFVSVAIDDVQPDDWMTQVYPNEIMARPERLYKKPEY